MTYKEYLDELLDDMDRDDLGFYAGVIAAISVMGLIIATIIAVAAMSLMPFIWTAITIISMLASGGLIFLAGNFVYWFIAER